MSLFGITSKNQCECRIRSSIHVSSDDYFYSAVAWATVDE